MLIILEEKQLVVVYFLFTNSGPPASDVRMRATSVDSSAQTNTNELKISSS